MSTAQRNNCRTGRRVHSKSIKIKLDNTAANLQFLRAAAHLQALAQSAFAFELRPPSGPEFALECRHVQFLKYLICSALILNVSA